MREASRTTFDDQADTRERALVATVIAIMAYASFTAYLFNSYAVEQFLLELGRLLDKFLW